MRYTVSKFPWKDWYSPLLNTSAHSIPTLRAAAVVSRAWLLWADPQVTNVSAARACACAISYSSLRGLSPPRMRSVRSSRLMKTLGPSVFIKRDDLTDLILGGDKPRKLEYEIAQAQARAADTLVTCGSAQSNHARLTTAAARKVGMECALVLSRGEYQSFQGNLLTVYLMGAQVHFADTIDKMASGFLAHNA